MAEQTAIQRTVARWTARIIPLILIGVVGYATYVFVVRLCVHFLLYNTDPQYVNRPAVIGLIIAYFIFLLPMAITYFRLAYVVNLDPGYLPLGPGAESAKEKNSENEKASDNDANPLTSELRNATGHQTVGGQKYSSGDTDPNTQSDGNRHEGGTLVPPGSRDSPIANASLAQFYSKSAFISDMHGFPKWCSSCRVYKPDRTHHCSDVGRCVEKMDHFCPWVGGVVAEHSFKFFVQFVTWTWIYCLYVMVVMAVYVAMQKRDTGLSLDPQLAVILGISAFFGSFTLGMSMSSAQFAVQNLTTIENLDKKTRTYTVALHIPPSTPYATLEKLRQSHVVVTYPGPNAHMYNNNFNSNSFGAENGTDSRTNASNSEAREFVVVTLGAGERPWDLGSWSANWKTVMGSGFWEWVLPLKRSPCCTRRSGIEAGVGVQQDSQFPFGPCLQRRREELGIAGG